MPRNDEEGGINEEEEREEGEEAKAETEGPILTILVSVHPLDACFFLFALASWQHAHTGSTYVINAATPNAMGKMRYLSMTDHVVKQGQHHSLRHRSSQLLSFELWLL